MSQQILQLFFLLYALLIAITIHEFTHALIANILGDPTAKEQGRMSLNPLVHLDPIGTLMLFLVHIGWGKPVPVNPNNFKKPRLYWALVSFGGPMANLLTASLFSLLFHILPNKEGLFGLFVVEVIFLNIVLMIFNLIPIPPLDGSKILYAILPKSINILELERIGPIILISIILADYIFHFGLLQKVILPVIFFVLKLLGVSINF